jgi:hypothetical protein
MARTVDDYRERARLLWPRLDSTRLRRTKGDPLRILRLVEMRSSLPRDVLLKMLVGAGPRRGTIRRDV